MKKRILKVILTVLAVFCIGNFAFADIDLDLGDEDTGRGSGFNKKGYVTIKGGFDFKGNMEYDAEATLNVTGYDESYSETESDDVDIKNGFSLSFEAISAVSDMASIGIGATFQLPRGIDEDTGDIDPKFNFLPIYGSLKLGFPIEEITAFLSIHAGWGFMFANDDLKDDGDISGGFYWGIGPGIMLGNGIQIELLYSFNRGKLEEEGTEDVYIPEIMNTVEVDYSYTEDYVYSKLTLSVGINF